VCWYVVDQNAVNNILQGVTISDLHIYGTNATLYQQLQEGIRLQQVYNAVIERISFDLLRVPIVCDKNCVSGEIAHLNVPTGGGNNQHPAPGGYAAIVIALNSGPVVHDVESNGFFYWGIITNAGGMTARNFVANYLQMGLIWDAGQTQGGNGVNGSIYENVEWDDEGSGLAECVLMLGYKTSLKFSGSIILGATTSPPVAATIKVQNCTNMVFEGTSITAPNSTNGYIFTFLGSTFVGDGIGAKQVIPIRITNQGLGTNGHWIDPANPGEIVIEGQEVSGFVTSNFASNATMTVSFDNFLNHTMQFTDTGAVLTGTTIVKLPAWWIREREIVNWTAQTLTIQGPSAPAAWLTATAYAVGAQVTHGGYTYSCTTAITSSATAPTATAYGATNADAGGAWTCFGPTQTISVPSGTRAKIWSDGVQFYLT